MAARDNLYSQLVSYFKILLPLAGIALLSTMFLFARQTDMEPTIPYAEIEEIARDQRISDPMLTGVTTGGSTVSITAAAIRPDPDMPDAFAITEVRTEIIAPDGSEVLITAGVAALDPRAQTARMTGLARMTASNGYVMETAGLIADLENGTVTSLGPLDVQAPFGELTAGALSVVLTEDGTGQRMVFNEGVRLLYQPQD